MIMLFKVSFIWLDSRPDQLLLGPPLCLPFVFCFAETLPFCFAIIEAFTFVFLKTGGVFAHDTRMQDLQ